MQGMTDRTHRRRCYREDEDNRREKILIARDNQGREFADECEEQPSSPRRGFSSAALQLFQPASLEVLEGMGRDTGERENSVSCGKKTERRKRDCDGIVGQLLCAMHPRSLSHLPAISQRSRLACKINTTAHYENLLRKTTRRSRDSSTTRPKVRYVMRFVRRFVLTMTRARWRPTDVLYTALVLFRTYAPFSASGIHSSWYPHTLSPSPSLSLTRTFYACVNNT